MENNYSVDNFNRLIIKKKRKRIIANGRWQIKNNNLLYVLTEKPEWRKKYKLPKKIEFKGNWSLDKNHNLIFTLQENETLLENQKLSLKVELLDVKEDALIFSLRTKTKNNVEEISVFKLTGRWGQDKYNRLQFFVEKEKEPYDTLTFKCAWDVKDNSLIYTYQKTYLKRKEKVQRTLEFKGFWQITQKNRLDYVLSLEKGSVFSFLVRLASPIVEADKRKIKYSVGIGYGRNFSQKNFFIEGNWRIDKNLGIYFEIKYKDGKINNVSFGATVMTKNNNQIILELKNSEGKSLGFAVSFNYSFIKKNANWFLKFAKDEGFEIKAGINILW